MAFSDDEIERYARHIVLADLGGPGQQKLKQARVLVIQAASTPSISAMTRPLLSMRERMSAK